MGTRKLALLPDRGVVTLTGEDARKYLQGVITNDINFIDKQPALHAGMLSPQGKILFDFFVVKTGDGFCLETSRSKAAELAQRLQMYRLRFKVDVADASADYTVAAIWGDTYAPPGSDKLPLWFADPRHPDLGYRALATKGSDWALGGEDYDTATPAEYHAHRISLGVPEGGKDYAFGDTFVHEALFDQLNGVSFKKGCYVGQEIVARMQNRGLARRRIVPVVADSELPASGSAIMAGGVEIGTLGSTAGNRGLAPLRIDRAAEFKEKGQALRAGDVELHIELPPWASFSLEPKPAGTPA
jgi:folate-binding protein YgfZ